MKGTHLSHCYQGEYETSCKYGDKDCPSKPISCKKEEFERVEFDEWRECGKEDYTGNIWYCDECKKKNEEMKK